MSEDGCSLGVLWLCHDFDCGHIPRWTMPLMITSLSRNV
jgi:hypothetical protein